MNGVVRCQSTLSRVYMFFVLLTSWMFESCVVFCIFVAVLPQKQGVLKSGVKKYKDTTVRMDSQTHKVSDPCEREIQDINENKIKMFLTAKLVN